MRQLVKLWKRPSYDGESFTFYLLYTGDNGKRKQKSLGHADARKAERERATLERELRMGISVSAPMRLSKFLDDSLSRTQGQVRQSTLYQTKNAMDSFIEAIGDIGYGRVRHEQGEQFIQACLDRGNTPGTVAKKLRHLKRLFNLAVYRGQLDENPMQHVKPPRSPLRKVRILSNDECGRLVKVAKEYYGLRSSRKRAYPVEWELLIRVALCTGMRRGELLNATWQDADFEKETIEVAPKRETQETWEWHIKDTDRRTLPLTSEIVDFLADHQTRQPERYPYIFVPSARYDYVQKLRRQEKWSIQDGIHPLNNFDRQYRTILRKARIDKAEFHDLRRTCITNWFANGLREYEVMRMAGHASFETTHRFYLAVREDLLDRARLASAKAMADISVANLLQQPFGCHGLEKQCP
jgi:integrase